MEGQNMTKRLFFTKLAALFIPLALAFILPPLLVDPFNVFHRKAVRRNGVTPNENFIKTSYILDNKDKFDSFAFGSSRMGALHVENIEGYRTYNMNYSFGIPQEHLDNIRTFLQAGVKIRMILINIDEVCCAIDWKWHADDPMHRPYPADGDFLSFYSLYMKPEIVLQSLPIIMKNKQDDEAEWRRNFYETGWWAGYDLDTGFKPVNADDDPVDTDQQYYFYFDALNALKEIASLCEENGIKLIVFSSPLFSGQYRLSVRAGYLDFLERLASVTPYYNFSCINAITTDSSNYLDPSHYKAQVGDMILDRIFCEDKSAHKADMFGEYVNADNVGQVLAALREQLGMQP